MNKLLLAWKVSTPLLRITVAVVLLVIFLVIRALLSGREPAPVQSTAARSAGAGKDAALNLCRDEIEGTAANRSSVEYSSFTAPPAIKQLPSGEWELFVKFSAANALGVRSTFIARCTTRPDGTWMTGFDTRESR